MRQSVRTAITYTAVGLIVAFAGLTAHALEQGDKGEGVRVLQQLLKNKGFYVGKTTVNYGPVTKRAVSKYQRSKGLADDGKAGKTTLGKLITTTKRLREGSNGLEVKWLQMLLGANLLDSEIAVDGKFRGGTKESVTDFQRLNGLTADGKVGPNTWAKLKN